MVGRACLALGAAMKTIPKIACPHCGEYDSRVTDTRAASVDDEGLVIRRRKCLACGRRFKTYEALLEPDKYPAPYNIL